MRVIEVEASMEATVNTGNFNNLKPGYRIVVALDEGDNPNEAERKATATVERWLDAQVKAIQADL